MVVIVRCMPPVQGKFSDIWPRWLKTKQMKPIKISTYTDDRNQIEALKAVMKAMKIKFVVDQDKCPYDPEFVEKI